MALPKITLSAGIAPKEGGIGTYLINLDTPAPVGGLVVYYGTAGSTATLNTDYQLSAGNNLTAVTANSFTLAAGATSAVLNLAAVADAVTDLNETVVLTLAASTDYSLATTNDILFAPHADYGMVSSVDSIITADFNGDGKLDLAITSSYWGYVALSLGDGSGGFLGWTSVSNNYVNETISADFNGDGKLDFAILNGGNGGGDISVLLGDGNGNFSGNTTVSMKYGPYSNPHGLISTDFNGDGKLDLITADTYYGIISVSLGDGSGGFSAVTRLSPGSDPRSVIGGDFNGDGKSDLAAFTASGIKVLLGDGSGGISTTINSGSGSYGSFLYSADFNADGKLDLATSENNGSVAVYLGDGSGKFNQTVDLPGNLLGWHDSITIGDFNGDGKLDLATTTIYDSGSGSVSVRLGDGSGGFSGTTELLMINNPQSVTSGDFNGDGKLDLATANTTNNSISILLNTTVVSSATLSIADVIPVNKLLNGTEANDLLTGGAGNDILDGNLGNDTLNGGDGNDLIHGDEGSDKLSGNAGDDLLDGGVGNDSLDGGDGNDLMHGDAGNDSLTGGAGDDLLYGGGGTDNLNGGIGNDVINGGAGVDKLTGGTGKDIFIFNNSLAAMGIDTITDFKAIDDTIKLENNIFTALTKVGVLAAASFVKGAGAVAHDANDFVVYDTTSGALSYDADGSGAGAAVQIALLGTTTHPALTNADFVVI